MSSIERGPYKHSIPRRENVAGQLHPSAKFTDEQILEMRRLYREGLRPKVICRKFDGLNYSSLWNIIRRRTWDHLP